jgi:hypothetical protein
MFSGSKERDFLKIFDDMKTTAEKLLTEGDSLDEQKKKQASRNGKRGYESELF